MSGGLKQQWGVGDPAQVGPDAQSQDLKAAFEKPMEAMAEHLQFTAANGERARHDPLAARSEALVPRYQAALGEVDPADPAKAKSSIDSLLADTGSLGQEVAAFRSETEKAAAEWQSRVAAYDAAVAQVEELQEWQHPKEAALRSLVDAIRGFVNDRAFTKAIAVLDQFLPKLQPIYEDYQKQKAAQQQYEPALAALQPRLAQAAQPSFAKLASRQSELATGQQQMESSAQGRDFVAALATATDLGAKVDAYTAEVQKIQQAKDQYEQVLGQVQPKLQAAPSPAPLKKLESMQAELAAGQRQMESAAQGEEFERALQQANDLGTKVDAYTAAVQKLQQAKQDYEQALGTLKPKLDAAPNPSPFQTLAAQQAELASGQQQMESAAQAEEFEQALQQANELGSKVDTYTAAVQRLQQGKQDYEQALAALKPKLEAAPNPSPFKKLESKQAELASGKQQMESSAQGEEFEQALQQANDLSTKVDAYLAAVKDLEEKKQQYEDALAKLKAKLEGMPKTDYPKLATMKQDIDTVKGQMESAAQSGDYEQALAKANDLTTKVDAYAAAVNDVEEKKQQYEDALEKLKAKLEGMPKTDYPKLATMKQDIDTAKGQMESAAQSGDYEQALAKTNDLTTKVDAYATAVKELEEKKKAYEGGFEAIKPKLAEALQSKNPDVAPVQKELLISKQQMEEAAKNGDYAQANTSLADVTAKVATIQAAKPEAGGGGLIPGITLEGEFPVGEFEQDAWGGKIKVTYKLKAIISAKLGSASSLKVVIDKDGLTGKVAVTVWESHGKLSLGGVDVFKDPKFEVKGKINKGGAEVKAEYSTDTPIGKASVAASLAEIKVGEKIKIGKLGGKLEGRPIQCGDVSIDGFEIKDIKATFTGEIEIGPDWINIVARKLAEEVIERGAADVGMELAIEGGLLVVVVGTILGSINELSKASDERELVAFVFRACNEYKQGMTNALAGKPKSGSGWLLLGWTYGSKKFVDLCADMKIDHPDQNEIEIHDAVANRSQQNASKYEGPANYDVGIQFWRTWVRDHHGPTTFPQHAKTAYLACFGRQANGSEPDFQLWVKAAK